MQNAITCQIESVGLNELLDFMRSQASDTFPSLKDEQWLQTFTKKLHNNAEFCLCRDKQGHLVGMIAFYANGKGVSFAYITHVYVSPIYREIGLFSRMLKIVVGYVRKMGFPEIRLEVGIDNNNAQSAYLKNGFMQCGSASPNSVYMSLILSMN